MTTSRNDQSHKVAEPALSSMSDQPKTSDACTGICFNYAKLRLDKSIDQITALDIPRGIDPHDVARKEE